ncbi:NADH:ubiquinone reductase (H(+)-translocating) [Ranunculus cassubicifolius]
MDLGEAIKNQAGFSLELTKHVMSKVAKDCNLVYSPLSIHVLLSLIAAGSKGETLDQLLSFLRSKSNEDLNLFSTELVSLVLADGSQVGGPKVSFANGVWIEKSLLIKQSFKEIVENVYKASAKQVDFQTKAVEVAYEVNSWAAEETRGLIEEILPSGSVDSLTRLVLANALYFKGVWDDKFDASHTKEHDFHLLGGTAISVPFMTSKKKQYLRNYNGFNVLRLPYQRGEDHKRAFSMYLILPDANDGLPALADKVTSEPGFFERHLISFQKRTVREFRIPKFKISYGFEATELLKRLGLLAPFSGGLTEMVDSLDHQSLSVSSIYHKAFIEVNEEGTEAAAASGARLVRMCGQVPIDFVADHPFMFLIREDNSGVVVFIGHVLNPICVA